MPPGCRFAVRGSRLGAGTRRRFGASRGSGVNRRGTGGDRSGDGHCHDQPTRANTSNATASRTKNRHSNLQGSDAEDRGQGPRRGATLARRPACSARLVALACRGGNVRAQHLRHGGLDLRPRASADNAERSTPSDVERGQATPSGRRKRARAAGEVRRDRGIPGEDPAELASNTSRWLSQLRTKPAEHGARVHSLTAQCSARQVERAPDRRCRVVNRDHRRNRSYGDGAERPRCRRRLRRGGGGGRDTASESVGGRLRARSSLLQGNLGNTHHVGLGCLPTVTIAAARHQQQRREHDGSARRSGTHVATAACASATRGVFVHPVRRRSMRAHARAVAIAQM